MAFKMSRKDVVLAFTVISLATLAVSLIALPTFAATPQIARTAQNEAMLNDEDWANIGQLTQTENVPVNETRITAIAKGWAFQRIDNETIKQYAAEMNLTLKLGSREGKAITIVDVNGSVTVNGVTYGIDSGIGLIATKRHAALIKAEGVDSEGNDVTLKIGARYFRWSGQLFVFRGRAVLQTGEKPMLLVQRGVAKVQ